MNHRIAILSDILRRYSSPELVVDARALGDGIWLLGGHLLRGLEERTF